MNMHVACSCAQTTPEVDGRVNVYVLPNFECMVVYAYRKPGTQSQCISTQCISILKLDWIIKSLCWQHANINRHVCRRTVPRVPAQLS